MLTLESDKLNFDAMQLAYQPKASTSMCTWTVTAVVDHFNREGAPVYGAAMDMSKAFDMVEWTELFRTLLDRKVDPMFLRLFLFIYSNQQCNVRWCGKVSERFAVRNGVRQGGVSSGIFFAIYIDKLLIILRGSNLGCHINGVFFGAMIFADDIFLLSASRSGLQAMVNLCQEFVAARNLKFGTNTDPDKSKTKCIIFTKNKKTGPSPKQIMLNDDRLPWVTQVKHLGHMLQSDNSMRIDIAQKRGAFIGKVNSLLQEFHHVQPDIFLRLLNTYATSLYGSNTWDILSAECERLYTSYNVTIRIVLQIDRCTHRYLVEPLSGRLHLKTMIASRFATFHHSLINSRKLPVRFLARLCERDNRTVLGRTLSRLLQLCNLEDGDLSKLNSNLIKKKLCYKEVPAEESWRVHLGKELLQVRQGSEMVLHGFTKEECEELLEFVCSS